jgi:hypothetical protein
MHEERPRSHFTKSILVLEFYLRCGRPNPVQLYASAAFARLQTLKAVTYSVLYDQPVTTQSSS